MIIKKWRGYHTTINKKTPYYCNIILNNYEDNHFIIVRLTNNKGLSAKKINENIYKSIIQNAYKNN